MKVCKICGALKELTEYYKSPQCRDGHRGECKKCFDLKRNTPARKAQRKFYLSRPDVKERLNASRRSESGKRKFRVRVKRTPSYVLSYALYRALKRRPTENPVTQSELMQIYADQNGRCAMSGKSMTWMNGRIHPTSISIDRIDSKRGYTRDNVRLLCHAVNRMKGDASDADILDIARAIIAHADKPPLWGASDERVFSLQ